MHLLGFFSSSSFHQFALPLHHRHDLIIISSNISLGNAFHFFLRFWCLLIIVLFCFVVNCFFLIITSWCALCACFSCTSYRFKFSRINSPSNLESKLIQQNSEVFHHHRRCTNWITLFSIQIPIHLHYFIKCSNRRKLHSSHRSSDCPNNNYFLFCFVHHLLISISFLSSFAYR